MCYPTTAVVAWVDGFATIDPDMAAVSPSPPHRQHGLERERVRTTGIQPALAPAWVSGGWLR